jgi:hypothetical protein
MLGLASAQRGNGGGVGLREAQDVASQVRTSLARGIDGILRPTMRTLRARRNVGERVAEGLRGCEAMLATTARETGAVLGLCEERERQVRAVVDGLGALARVCQS